MGLNYAGKTTIISRLIKGVFDDSTKRTLGVNVNELELHGTKFVFWDIGGQDVFRDTLWLPYIAGSAGIIYVIDSSDQERFNEAKEELWKYVIDNHTVADIPILILANKQDLTTSKSAGEVARALDLHKVARHSYAIMPTSAQSGLKLDEALEWLHSRITERM